MDARKSLSTFELEKEFKEYMASYPKVEDPDVKLYMRYYKIWTDLK